MGIKNTYTANVLYKGDIVGSVICRNWFWWSPVEAHKTLVRFAEASNSGFKCTTCIGNSGPLPTEISVEHSRVVNLHTHG